MELKTGAHKKKSIDLNRKLGLPNLSSEEN